MAKEHIDLRGWLSINKFPAPENIFIYVLESKTGKREITIKIGNSYLCKMILFGPDYWKPMEKEGLL